MSPDTIDPATILKAIDVIRHMPDAHAPAGEFFIIERACAALLELVPDLEAVQDKWSLVPIEPSREMTLAGMAALRQVLGPAGMKLLLSSRPDIARRIWIDMTLASPPFVVARDLDGEAHGT